MFNTTCTNKGCYKLMAPYLDPSTDKVYCCLCDKELVNITYFAKSQMKSLKQYKKVQPISFSVKCQKCAKEDRPVIVKDVIICKFCKNPHTHLSEPFKILLKQQLKNIDKDV